MNVSVLKLNVYLSVLEESQKTELWTVCAPLLATKAIFKDLTRHALSI